MSKRITCKVHDAQERVTHVGVEGEGRQTMLSVWERIDKGRDQFHVVVDDKPVDVRARERNGTKYLTTHPDGYTPNNLDNIRNCPQN